jgi:N-acetylmuramoyl-L-alanine amidase
VRTTRQLTCTPLHTLRKLAAVEATAQSLLRSASKMSMQRGFTGLVGARALTAFFGLHTALLGVLATGCISGEEDTYSTTSSEVSVSAYTSSGCSTAVVLGLSKQIADEISCLNPTSLSKMTAGGNLTITGNAVLLYLGAPAKAALANVTATSTIQVNSAFRTVAQQYLLYRWYQQGRCGISAAAAPGRSNHQSGRALDLANYGSRISAMGTKGWSHSVPGDPVHFDHLGSPDIRGKDVLAFQRLWNRNNPSDKIAEDGAYGPATEARLRQAPATGFATGAMCGTRVQGADVLAIDGPDRIAPGAHATYSITVENTGQINWPATTRLVVTGAASSELYDAQSWTSPMEVGPINTAIAAGARGTLDVEIVGPMVTEETPAFTQFSLSDGTSEFGTINIAVTVTPNGDHDISGESDDQHDDGIEVSGGCNAGGRGSWASILIPALIVLRRRRR